MESWNHGIMELWNHGIMESWVIIVLSSPIFPCLFFKYNPPGELFNPGGVLAISRGLSAATPPDSGDNVPTLEGSQLLRCIFIN